MILNLFRRICCECKILDCIQKTTECFNLFDKYAIFSKFASLNRFSQL